MIEIMKSCPQCSAPLAHGYLSSFNGPIQWTTDEPGMVTKWLQLGKPLVDVSSPSTAYLQGWRCETCHLIIFNYQQGPA